MGIVREVMCAAIYMQQRQNMFVGCFSKETLTFVFVFCFFVCSSRLALKSKLVTGNQFD